MPDYHRAYVPGGTFFFTIVTFHRQPTFKDESAVSLLRQCLHTTIRRRPFVIDAMVLLPDHLHAIWTLPEGDCDYSNRWREIKARFSRLYLKSPPNGSCAQMRRKGQRSIWQERFWEHAVTSQADYNRHCDYIHFNPVKHGLATSPLEWKLSSFEQFVARGLYEPDWGAYPDEGLLKMDLE